MAGEQDVPEISVCMTLLDGASFLAEQIESVLSQLPARSEVVVADDGSRDGSPEFPAALGDPRVRILPPDDPSRGPLGPVRNAERALAASRGKIVFLADQDDVWAPDKVARVLEALRSATLVLHDAWLYRPGADGKFVRAERLSEIRPWAPGLFRNWLRNGYVGCCMAFRRELLREALPFPKGIPMHDQWLGLTAGRRFSVAYLPEPLILWRRHAGTATRPEGGGVPLSRRIRWRLGLALALLRR